MGLYLLRSTSSVWKRKGYYQITHDLDSDLAFCTFVDLNQDLLDCFDLIDLSKDINEANSFDFPEGFQGKNSKLLLIYYNF